MDNQYYSDTAIRERCMLMAINAHTAMRFEDETIRETAHKIFSFIKCGLVNDEIESAD